MLKKVTFNFPKIQSNHKILSAYVLIFVTISLLFFSEIASLIILKIVSINYIDSLDGVAVYNKIIGQMHLKGFDQIKIFLNENIKWYYLDGVFRPLILNYIIFNFKFAFFFEKFLFKLIAFYCFFRLANKSFELNKKYSILLSVIYALITTENTNYPQSLLILSYPYILYLNLKLNNLNLKNFFFLFFIGSNSSIIFELPALLTLYFFIYFFYKKKNKNNYYKSFIAVIFPLIIFNFYIFFNLDGTTFHRSEYFLGNNINQEFINALKSFFYLGYIKNDLIFKISFLILQFFILIIIVFKKKILKLFFLYLFLFFISIFFIKLITIVFYDVLPENLRSVQFTRIQRIQPLILLIFYVYFFQLKKNIFVNNFLTILLVFSIFSFNSKPFVENVFRVLVYSNFNQIEIDKLKTLYFKRKYLTILKKIKHKKNYKFENKYSLNFDKYYNFAAYSKIKEIVMNNKVISLGLDPMVAVANDIYVVDGYHQLYPLTYKKKFRQVIKYELEKNYTLKNYYDNYGSRVYFFFSDYKNIDFDIEDLKKLNVSFIISKYQISKHGLEKEIINCCKSENVYLYKIL